METLRNENIILSEKASEQLIREFTNPDMEAIKRRDEYLNSIEVIREQHENYVDIEISNLDLEFLSLEEKETKVTIEDTLGFVKEQNSYDFLY